MTLQPQPSPGHGRSSADGTGWVLAGLGSVLVAAIILVSVLHWGGAYPHIGAKLQLLGAGLWAVVAAVSIRRLVSARGGPDWVDALVAAFLLYAGWTYLRTPVEYPARLEWCWILTYAAIFTFMRHGLPGRRWALALIGVVIVAAALSCVYAFLHKDNPTHLIWGLPRANYGARISGTFGCPNHFANLMVTSALACLFLGTYSRFPWPLRIFLFYLALVLTAGLYLSVSRGGYIAWVAGMLVVAWFLFRTPGIRWWWKTGIAAAVVAGTVLVIIKNPFVMERLDQMMGGDIRILLARLSIQLWQQAPIWGQGIGAYDFAYLRHHGPDLQTRAFYAHCDYLNTLVDYGAVGLVLVLLFLAACAVLLIQRGRAVEPREHEQLLRRLGWAALAAMAMHSVFDFSLHIPACAIAFFTVLGAAVMKSERQNGAARTPWSRARWAALTLGAIVAALTLAPLAWKTHRGETIGRLTQQQVAAMDPSALDQWGEQIFQTDPDAYMLLERVGDAFRVLAAERALELREASLERYKEVLRQREEAGRLALKYYQRAYRAAPLFDALLVKQGMVLDVLQRHSEAFLAYSTAVKLQPYNRYFHLQIGLHLLETGQPAAALPHLERSANIPVDPREGPAMARTARAALETARRLAHSPTP